MELKEIALALTLNNSYSRRELYIDINTDEYDYIIV